MNKHYTHAIYIGRFNPPHKGHIDQMLKGLSLADKLIIVLGSHFKARDTKDPFIAGERESMIKVALPSELHDRIEFIYMRDFKYNNPMWFSSLEYKVSQVVAASKGLVTRICVIGAEKDRTSWYLKHLPQYWKRELSNDKPTMHSTDIRKDYFEHGTVNPTVKDCVPAGIYDKLVAFTSTNYYKELKATHDYYSTYDPSRFPRNEVTADTMVVKDGHVLVVERKINPGKGMLALPGGFVSPEETIIDAAFRELKEETGIMFPIHVMKRKHIVDQHYFDAIDRSLRARIITHVFCVKLPDGGRLPEVVGRDDAAKAIWIPLEEIGHLQDRFFEDHYHIINYFANKFVGGRFFDEEII